MAHIENRTLNLDHYRTSVGPYNADASRRDGLYEDFLASKRITSGHYLDNKPVGWHKTFNENGTMIAAVLFNYHGQPMFNDKGIALGLDIAAMPPITPPVR